MSVSVWQGFELLLSALGDPSERVVSATHQVFLPAYAAWTTELGNLQSHLIPTLLNKIEKLLRVNAFFIYTTESLKVCFKASWKNVGETESTTSLNILINYPLKILLVWSQERFEEVLLDWS